ncbi:MAG: DUF2059 domain-containing protein [Proteobacteria bacterium]|nr:DUF2059 domain-containing protein [Pseudomonadota bacterium]
MRARPNGIFALVLAASVAASAAHAADTIGLARKLVGYTGGVSLILRNFEGGMAASVQAPDIFRQSFEQALADNAQTLAAADEDLAQTYARLYSADQMSAEIAFYESPEGQNIMTKSRDTFGVVVWPDPGTPGLTAEQSAALVKFHETVKRRAAIAAGNSEATDAIMTAETDALVKIRSAAFANYCKIRDCKAENVTPPPQ